MMRKQLFIAVMLLTVFGSCEYKDIVPADTVVVGEISFSKDIEPIFKAQGCTNCHSGSTKPDLTSENAYKSLNGGGFINTGNPSKSEIYVVAKPGADHTANYTSQQAQQILVWIEQGATNN